MDKTRYRGLSLQEIMITVFIVNIALFAIAGIVVATMKATKKSGSVSAVTIMSNSIMERYLYQNKNRLGSLKGIIREEPYEYHYDFKVEETDLERTFYVVLTVEQKRIDEDGVKATVATGRMTTLVYGFKGASAGL